MTQKLMTIRPDISSAFAGITDADRAGIVTQRPRADTSAASSAVSHIALFEGLSESELAEISTHLHFKTFPAAAPILTMQQRSGALYFIHQGTVKICIEGRHGAMVIIAVSGPGEVLGEINAVDNLGHSASVVALETCSLPWMDRDLFHSYRRQMPVLTDNLLKVLARRARFASARLQVMATSSVCGRLAAQLVAFADHYGCPGVHGGTLIPLRLTQSDLACLIGASRQHTSLVLTNLKKLRAIALDDNHRITILDRAALERCE